MISERKHRLPMSCYEGLIRASFTLCTKDRKRVFIEESIVKIFVDILDISIKKYSCVNWVYSFMPDHLHFILEGKNLDANLWKAVTLFKQKTGYWFLKNLPSVKWQKDFFDYVHRTQADLKQHIDYILDNPVREEIVKNWRDYRYKGSLDFNVEDIVW